MSKSIPAVFTWRVSSAALSVRPTTIASVVAAGLVVPHAAGDIAISASYNGSVNSASHAFAVAPDRDAIVLAPYLIGHVLEADGITGITGATNGLPRHRPTFRRSTNDRRGR
jgi:hypothetical protein